jgi:hypothetical protein
MLAKLNVGSGHSRPNWPARADSTLACVVPQLRVRFGLGVSTADDGAFQQAATQQGGPVGPHGLVTLPDELLSIGQGAACGSELHIFPVEASHDHTPAIQQPHGAVGNRIEHRLHIRRRAGDDLQDAGCCGLPLQHFPQFPGEPGHPGFAIDHRGPISVLRFRRTTGLSCRSRGGVAFYLVC